MKRYKSTLISILALALVVVTACTSTRRGGGGGDDDDDNNQGPNSNNTVVFNNASNGAENNNTNQNNSENNSENNQQNNSENNTGQNNTNQQNNSENNQQNNSENNQQNNSNLACDDGDGLFLGAETIGQYDPDSDVLLAVVDNGAGDLLYVELYFDLGATQGAHTFEFDGENYATCHTCTRIATGCTDEACEIQYLGTSGRLIVSEIDVNTGVFAFVLEDVTYEEVTIDEGTFESEVIDGGNRICVAERELMSDFDTPIEPEDHCLDDAPECNLVCEDLPAAPVFDVEASETTTEYNDENDALVLTMESPDGDILNIELFFGLGANAEPHTFEFDGVNYAECHTCALLARNCGDEGCESFHLALGGSVTFTTIDTDNEIIEVSLDDATFVEVELDQTSFASFVVDGGDNLCMADFSIGGEEVNTLDVGDQTIDPVNEVVIGEVTLENGGFVVIHEDDGAGSFGGVIGASAYLEPGLHTVVTVTLDRDVADGETLHAMLHADDGNMTYGFPDEAGDGPLLDSRGEVIVSAFAITVTTCLASNGWPASSLPDDYMSDGLAVGDRMELFSDYTDQNGSNDVSLGQFYGAMLLIEFGALWAPPVNEAAQSAQSLLNTLNAASTDYTVERISILIEGAAFGEDPTPAEIGPWARANGFSFPLLIGAGERWDDTILAYPTYFVLDPTLQIRDIVEGYPGDEDLGMRVTDAWDAFIADNPGFTSDYCTEGR